MNWSERIEEVPEKAQKSLEDSLNELSAKGVREVTIRNVSKEAGIREEYTTAILEELNECGYVESRVELSCSSCKATHDSFSTDNLPEGETRCDICNRTFDTGNRQNWQLVFRLNKNKYDFFRDIGQALKVLSRTGPSLSTADLKELYQSVSGIESPQNRGVKFDYLVGLLFSQVDGVEVNVKPQTPIGEIDLRIIGHSPPNWFRNLIGLGTLVENKWESDEIGPAEVTQFSGQLADFSQRYVCECGLFISMSGFTDRGRMSMERATDPRIHGFRRAEFESALNSGTPKSLMDSI